LFSTAQKKWGQMARQKLGVSICEKTFEKNHLILSFYENNYNLGKKLIFKAAACTLLSRAYFSKIFLKIYLFDKGFCENMGKNLPKSHVIKIFS
jgi:hypothetical protein